jgi:aldose 1-epimerase
MNHIRTCAASFLLAVTLACSGQQSEISGVTVNRTPFGKTPDGKPVEIFHIRNVHGIEVGVMTYGGTVVSLQTPDRDGNIDDIVLGYDNLEGYLRNSPYLGAITGRYANRIAAGRFEIDGVPFQLAVNNPPNHLHGGVKGFDKVVWQGEPRLDEQSGGVRFTYISPDGDQGYPGELTTHVTYLLNNDNELSIEYEATTTKPTLVNLTHHSYFNLAGAGNCGILDHELQIEAGQYTPIDATSIPTGELAPVEGTPFDFRTPTKIGARIEQDHEQLRHGRGYDHNYVLNKQDTDLTFAARVTEKKTGRVLEVWTTEPGLQFYSGNFLDGSITGKSGHVYTQRCGFCLEPQHYPDSPNRPQFPSTVLRPGEQYRSRTVLAFKTVR